MKKTALVIVIVSIAFNLWSCSNDNLNDNFESKTATYSKESLSEENLIKDYAKAYYTLSRFIGENEVFFKTFDPGKYNFNNDKQFIDFISEMKLDKVENVKAVAEVYPRLHKDINDLILKEINATGNKNISKTEIFAKFKVEIFELRKTDLLISYGSKKECLEDWQDGYSDCREDFLIEAGLSVIAAGAGIWPGLVAGAATMLKYEICIGRNDRDYKKCMGRLKTK